MKYSLELEKNGSPSLKAQYLKDCPLDLKGKEYYDIQDLKEYFDSLNLTYHAFFGGHDIMSVSFCQYSPGPTAFTITLRKKYDPSFKNDMDFLNGKLTESVYARGFKKSFATGDNIFGLVKDIQEYTDGMDKDAAVEEAVFATADYVKDGHL